MTDTDAHLHPSPAPSSPDSTTPANGRLRGRVTAALTGAWGVVVGLAPHVLHHVGPLVGTALLAGAGGTVLFGAIGLVAAIPTLRRVRRRFGSWRAPAVALALYVVLFLVSALLIGPLISGPGRPTTPDTPLDHEVHHVG